ncbi:MAG: DUF2339 domain-containing protein [Thermodesulfobacteriota bacterium]
MILTIFLGIIGAIIGGAVLHEGGAVMGLVLGCLTAVVVNLKHRLMRLEQRLDSLTALRAVGKKPDRKTDAAPEPETEPARPSASSPAEAPPSTRPESSASESQPPSSEPPPLPWERFESPRIIPAHENAEAAASATEPEEDIVSRITGAIRDFFTGGNLVVRIGVVILFFGVAFLFKFIAERTVFPIEFRLAGVALGAIGLLILGWRLRDSRPGYGLILQGGSVGMLYLTLFAAARLYSLIPLPLTFGLMVGLVVLSGALAVLQDAKSLAAFAAAGGFLAPVLTSTGRGSHVMLFSYYALLNAGILQVAWFKAWRPLNLLGFIFTFVIGTGWGYRYYRPEYFTTTEPFLILFFLFFVAISVLFALRRPPRLKGYVDGTLVFGLPIVVFALQVRLVTDFEYGLAISALALSGFYILLATFLWRRKAEGMRMLTEAFLALGVVFGSLAIPLALDGRWTAAAWSLEGAALVWVGVRQKRTVTRNFGLFLQWGAGAAFWGSTWLTFPIPTGGMPVVNGLFLGALTVASAGLFSAYYLERHQESLRKWESGFHWVMLVWGVLWWIGAGIHEIRLYAPVPDRVAAGLLFAAFSGAAMGRISRGLDWRGIGYPPMALLPVMGLIAVERFSNGPAVHPFARWHVLAWAAAFAAHYDLLRRFEGRWPSAPVRIWHLGGLLLGVFLLAREAAWWVHRWVAGADTWRFIAWIAVPGAAVLLLLARGERISWPVSRFSREYLSIGAAMLCLFLWLWEFGAAVHSGNPRPLPYLPVLNPLDAAQMFGFAVLFRWLLDARVRKNPEVSDSAVRILYFAVSLAVFFWLNGLTARTVHYWGGVPFTARALFESVLFQAAISILWALTAFVVMAVSARKGSRTVWFAGAILLGCEVLKLFVVDLAGSGTIARIVSFLAVGGLMLVIGYVSPLPPRPEDPGSAASQAGSESS